MMTRFLCRELLHHSGQGNRATGQQGNRAQPQRTYPDGQDAGKPEHEVRPERRSCRIERQLLRGKNTKKALVSRISGGGCGGSI